MEIKEITNANYFETITDIIQNRKETFVYGVADDYVVLKGNNVINDEYCKEHNLSVYNSKNMGGAIIIGAGDVEFDIFRYDGWEDGEYYSSKILLFLKTKINNISIENNDFLIDGKYKVGSFSSVNLGDGFIYTGFHFSLNVNLEYIKNICTKPMNKIPKGLNEYGITTEKIKSFVEDFIKNTIGDIC